MKNSNVTVRQDLTEYAFGVMQSLDKAMALANAIAPIVPTGSAVGGFNKFESTAAFTVYNAARAVGGQATRIKFMADKANFACQPFGLRIDIDGYERQAIGDNASGLILLEQSKVRTLQINSVVAHLSSVIAKALAGVAAESGLGDWSDPNVDPIAEINTAIKAVWLKCGVVPNRVVMDFGAWTLLASNPLTLKRMPGADLTVVTPDRISALLMMPGVSVIVAETAVNAAGGFGNASATRTGVLSSNVLVFASSDMPTQYDPSFMKTFAPAPDLFTSVYTYDEQPHLTWYENDWTVDTQVVSALMAARITVA
jgi:hypothetical protein